MLLVDSRVGSIELLPRLAKLMPGKVDKCQLASADVCFDGNGPNGTVAIGVERKRVSDLMNSIRSGRLSGEQLVNMSQMYGFVYLVVEGRYKPGPSGILQVYVRRGRAKGEWRDLVSGRERFLYSELDNYLTSVELNANVMVRRTADEYETCVQIVDLYRWWQKDWDRHHAHEAIKHQEGVTLQRASLLRRMAAELPGIGWVRSGAVERAFGNVREMVLATEREWAQVEVPVGAKRAGKVRRIGGVTAKRIVKEMRRIR